MNILFICTANMMRSLTAEFIYQKDKRFLVKSAGTATFAQTKISRELLQWADWVIAMEDYHIREIKRIFPDYQGLDKIIALQIPDIYSYMQAELIELIQEKFEEVYQKQIINNAS
jgi:predicted protein tyrosine phosphatase